MAAPTDTDIAKFISRLEAITIAANVNSITIAEHEFVGEAKKFHGLLTVSNAFRSFFIETVDLLNESWGPHIKAIQLPADWHAQHTWLLPRLAFNFRWLCGAEQQAFAGYPYPAFAQVRNIFDSAVITSAVLQGFATFQEAEGLQPGGPFDADVAHKRRMATEKTIFSKMTGKASGLSDATLRELVAVDRMFDLETHGQRLSGTESMNWLQRQAPLHFLPKYDDTSFAPFMNRYLETMWLVHRLLPHIRPPGALVPSDWSHKWTVLNESLRTCAFSLTAQFGKPIGQAIVEFVDAKFPFDASSTIKTLEKC